MGPAFGGSEKMPRDVPVIGLEPPLDAYRNFRGGACPFGVGVAHKIGLRHNGMDPGLKVDRGQHNNRPAWSKSGAS